MTTSTQSLPPAIREKIRWNTDGLIAAIAQDEKTGAVLMLAWMNEAALAKTILIGEVHYWSRSRQKLWHKGEESGQIQKVKTLMLDCDGDAILIKVIQEGVACHTGRRSCFFYELVNELKEGNNASFKINAPVVKSPESLYANPKKQSM